MGLHSVEELVRPTAELTTERAKCHNTTLFHLCLEILSFGKCFCVLVKSLWYILTFRATILEHKTQILLSE